LPELVPDGVADAKTAIATSVLPGLSRKSAQRGQQQLLGQAFNPVNTEKTVEQEKMTTQQQTLCVNCKGKEAEIFTAIGDYCIECWRLVTETGVIV
jgi:hypothetical protein